ncbi:hypothetical protein C2I36_04675 [Rhodobacteraceae bacterium WD3A24]|nr:hypothetical protein C2I36_04675 [Rhodobacteraceae bacterium WD3A24]
MRRALSPVLAAALLLAGCASPSPRFFGAEPVRVTQDGFRVAVYRRGNAAQAIRLDYARRGKHASARAALRGAIIAVTGCALDEGGAEGDSGVLVAELDCSPG